MNGKPRDHFVGDIVDLNLPRYSRHADELIGEILELSGQAEREELESLVRRWERTLEPESYAAWWNPPWSHLSEFIPGERVSELESQLGRLLERRRRDAADRGWERR